MNTSRVARSLRNQVCPSSVPTDEDELLDLAESQCMSPHSSDGRRTGLSQKSSRYASFSSRLEEPGSPETDLTHEGGVLASTEIPALFVDAPCLSFPNGDGRAMGLASAGTSRQTSRGDSFYSCWEDSGPAIVAEESFYDTEDMIWATKSVRPAQIHANQRSSRRCRSFRGFIWLMVFIGICAAVMRKLETTGFFSRLDHGGGPSEIVVPQPRPASTRIAAVVVGMTALALSCNPPAGQFASCVALGLMLLGRAGTKYVGVLGGAVGAVGGAMLGCVSALVVCAGVAPLAGQILYWCGDKCRCRSTTWAWLGFMAADMVPAIVLFGALLNLN